jgi:hypothetical protein
MIISVLMMCASCWLSPWGSGETVGCGRAPGFSLFRRPREQEPAADHSTPLTTGGGLPLNPATPHLPGHRIVPDDGGAHGPGGGLSLLDMARKAAENGNQFFYGAFWDMRTKAWHGRADRHKADNIAQLVDELRVIGKLELVDAVRLETMRAPDALDETRADIDGFRHHVAVQWVPSAGGSVRESATTRLPAFLQ